MNDLSICRLDLGGVQTLRNIQVSYDRLSAALAEHQAVEIDCSRIAEMDLSLIQLLLAAKRSAERSGKSLKLAGPADGRLRVALDRAGFLAAGADQDGHDTAFWLQGPKAS